MSYVNKRFEKKSKQPSGITVPLYLPDEGMSEELIDEICGVLAAAPFNKLSTPLYAFRADLGQEAPAGRTVTVGYIKRFDDKEGTFVVQIFSGMVDAVTAIKNLVVIPQFSQYDGKLGTITRLVITSEPAKEAAPAPAATVEDTVTTSPSTADAEPEKFEV